MDRQGIHVGPQQERRSGLSALDIADDPGAPHAGPVLDTEPGQLACDDARRAFDLETDFGMGMDIAPDLDQALFLIFGKVVYETADVVDFHIHCRLIRWKGSGRS